MHQDIIKMPDIHDISNHILAVVRQYRKLTFPEILKHCEKAGLNISGTAKIVAGDNSDLVVWDKLSDEFVDAMQMASNTGNIKLMAVHQDLYLKSGFIEFPGEPGYEAIAGQKVWLPTAVIWAAPKFSVSGFSFNVSNLLH